MKGKGIFGFAKEIITFILIAGLFFAFLALFFGVKAWQKVHWKML